MADRFTTWPLILPPRAELRIPMADDEDREPILLGRAGVILMKRGEGRDVLLTNTTKETVGATLVLAPAALVKLGKVPWASLAKQGAAYIERFVQDLATQK